MGPGDTDAIDSNGNLYINGGTINITANSPFDYDGTAEHKGGTIIVNGTETDTITNQMMGGGMKGMQNKGNKQMEQNGEMPNGEMPTGEMPTGERPQMKSNEDMQNSNENQMNQNGETGNGQRPQRRR